MLYELILIYIYDTITAVKVVTKVCRANFCKDVNHSHKNTTSCDI